MSSATLACGINDTDLHCGPIDLAEGYMYATFVALTMLVLILLSTGCSVQPGRFAKEWSDNMRELQVYPVFPPREDLQVGDVYLLTDPTPEAIRSPSQASSIGFLPIGLWIGRVPGLNQVLNEFYSDRTEFPATDSSVVEWLKAIKTNPDAMMPQAKGVANLFSQKTQSDRLRQVGFPEFFSATVKGGSLGALIPFEVLPVGLGFNASDAESVTVSVPVAESYGLPAPIVLKPIVTDKNGSICLDFTKLDISDISAFSAKLSDASRTYVSVITEVYYARAIDTKVTFKSGFATRVKASVPATNALAKLKNPAIGHPAEPLSKSNAINDAKSGTAGDPEQAASNAAKERMDTATAAMMEQEVPGVATSVYAASDAGVGLRRTFSRPMAIGYRGLFFDITKGTCGVAAIPISAVPTDGDARPMK